MTGYDLIVVGAGSAGCVIASRVAARGARVLVLEAGPDYPDLALLPSDLRNGNNNSYVAHDWGFSYQPHVDGGTVAFPRGRVVGGSSAVNTCIALRGEPADYDEWADIAGPEWSWDRCLPAFVRLESDADYPHEPHHGADGPLPIRRYPPAELLPIHSAFLDACAEIGLPHSPDHNAPGTSGYGITPMNKRGHDRVSLAEAYLSPVRDLENLEIRPAATVRRVVIKGMSVRGVELDSGDRIDGDRVVLCAGSIMTPPILLRSGVGPKEPLDRLGIDAVMVREGVGARLFDHPGTMVLLRMKPDMTDAAGPLIQTCARLTVRETNDLFVEPFSFAAPGRRRGAAPGRRDAAGRGGAELAGIAVAAYRSYGVGRLSFASAETSAAPGIEMRYFERGDDLGLMAEGVRLAARLACTGAMRKVHDGIFGLDDAVLTDDDLLRAHIRRFSGSGYHPVGTAPMGPPDDPLAVCDGRGHVYGLTGLSVGDASLMPVVPRANTNIPTVMIGERVGEWLAAG